MTTETIVKTPQTPAAPTTNPLDQVAEQVRRDSQRDADQYLEQTVVPHGGE